MQDDNKEKSQLMINSKSIPEFINQWLFKMGVLLIVLAVKSFILQWILNALLVAHSITFSLGEVFLGLLALTLIASCVKNKNEDLDTITLLTINETLQTFGTNQMIQNQQILSGLSMILRQMGYSDETEDEPKSQILNEDANTSGGNT